jgi:uncharacterized protein (TIGR00290 family)
MMESSGLRDYEVLELKRKFNELKDRGFRYVISGVVSSNYQKKVIDSLCSELNLTHITPLWGLNSYELLKTEVKLLEFVVVAIQAYGLDIRWLGERLTVNNINEFISVCNRFSINPVGEGGEFETFVTSSPLFNNRKICIKSSKKVWYPNQWVGYLIIEDAELC